MRFIKVAAVVVLTATVALSTAYNTNFYAYALSSQASDLEEKGLVTGIVKENNPSLGYLTLYFQDGSGADPEAFEALTSHRNFTYGYEIPVLRDGLTVTAESIQPGDQVFLKLDEDGTIQKLSAKSYYKPVYGTIHLKNVTGLIVKKDNGIYIEYPLTAFTPIYNNGRPGNLSDLLPGERIKLLVQTDSDTIDIAAIELEKNSEPVSGIYRGNIELFDRMRDALLLSGVQEFVNGRWENSSTMGIQSLPFSSDYKARPAKRVSGTAYYVTKRANDGIKKIITASYRVHPQYDTTFKDNLLNLSDAWLELENSSNMIGFDKNTIAVKDGRLVDISALDTLDPIKGSMEKSIYGSNYLATVLVSESTAKNVPIIYRGRIKSVDPTKSITLESFAQLNGVTWNFTNTPKTFDIDLASTRLFDEDGIGNMRELNSSTFGQSVYIVANGTRILLISTAPYAASPLSGRILSFTGGTVPTGLKLIETMEYDTQTYKWSAHSDMDLTIPSHAVVVKKGQVGTTTLLKPGDHIKIIRHVQSQSGILVLCD